MRILLVSSKYMPEYSGSGFRAHNLYRRLASKSKDLHIDILCGSVTENMTASYEYEGVRVHRIACKPYFGSKSILGRRFSDFCDFSSEHAKTISFLNNLEHKPDLIHVFGRNYVTASVINYALKNDIPAMIELCNEMDYPFQHIPFPNRLWISNKLPKKHFFICISEKLRKTCLNAGIKEEKIWCRPNPVDDKRFTPVTYERKYELRKKNSGFGEDKKLIVYIAKFRKSKNHIFLLDVIEKLPGEFVLFMKGPLVEEGPLKDMDQNVFIELKSEIALRNLGHRVKLEKGFCDNVEEYYQMADVYAFPSLSEGLGTPILEAIATAVPVVANRIADVTDTWIKDGQNGFVSEMEAAKFAEKISASLSIGEDMLRLSSEEILGHAGTSVIDNGYMELIKKQLR